jgi:hypothetical protein
MPTVHSEVAVGLDAVVRSDGLRKQLFERQPVLRCLNAVGKAIRVRVRNLPKSSCARPGSSSKLGMRDFKCL